MVIGPHKGIKGPVKRSKKQYILEKEQTVIGNSVKITTQGSGKCSQFTGEQHGRGSNCGLKAGAVFSAVTCFV